MSGQCNDCGGNPCICSEMRSAGIGIDFPSDKCPDCGSDPIEPGDPCPVCERDAAIEAVKRGAYKAKRQRDNWKARYVALVAALRDDGLVRAVAHNDEWSSDIRYTRHGAIYDYRARLLAKIDERRKMP